MELETGQQLLHYRLVEKIGEGGMGVVWKAVDTTLDRDVAIKVLPQDLAVDGERMARFEREARVLASLNHAHISGIYGIHSAAISEAGVEQTVRFLAMELVPGEDLSQVLERGPISRERTLQVMREVAEALEAAHDSGIIHRDLKPANVRLTLEGKAKVLDFGLAKAYDPMTASDPMRSATMTSAGTVAGLILGTAAYMSPEQASGQPTDRRADIWSFGVMLHEMLSGKRLFAGETISHTLADVLRAPINLDDLPADTPASIRRLIERCLDRDKLRRLRDIGEARIAIEDALADPDRDSRAVDEGTGARTAPPSKLPWIVAGAAVVLAAIGFVWRTGPSSVSEEPVRRFALEVPNSGNTRQGDGLAITISSDGDEVITRGGTGSDDMLYRRSINDFEPQRIEGTTSGRNPFYSPDDRWIGFLMATYFKKVRANGGPSITIGQSPASPDGVHWGGDDYIYYGHQGRIWRISAEGGEGVPLTEGDPEENLRLGFPYLLPGAKTLLCSTNTGRVTGRLYALDLDTLELKDLEMQGSDPRYLLSGHVLFAQSERVFVAPFDLDRLEFTASATPVHPRAWVDQGQIQMDVSASGTVVYLPVARGETQALVSVGMDGEVTPLIADGLPFISLNDPRFSRDGRRLLISVEGGAIWMIDLDTQTPTLMSESGFYPQWSPDGSEIIYGSTRGKSFDIYRRPVDLSAPEELILDVKNNLRAGDWSRQGVLVIREEIPDKGMDLNILSDVDGAGELATLMDGDDDELAPIVSYDGKWLAYVSDYSGSDEIYVTSFPETGPRLQISMRGGNSPTWAPDGSVLYYFENTSLIAASIETEPRFRVLGRKTLFGGEYVQYRWSRQYDIHPDGQSFVLVKNPARGNVEVVSNWFAELSRLGN